MKKKKSLTNKSGRVRELTRKNIRAMQLARAVLPSQLVDILPKHQTQSKKEYVSFNLSDYVDNPVAFARIEAGLTQAQLARRMKVKSAHISKLEAQNKVTAKILKKVKEVIEGKLK